MELLQNLKDEMQGISETSQQGHNNVVGQSQDNSKLKYEFQHYNKYDTCLHTTLTVRREKMNYILEALTIEKTE